MEILKKNFKNVRDKNVVTKLKNVFDGIIVRLGTADYRIAELQNKSIETPQTEEQRKKKKRLEKMKQYSRTIRK